MFKWCGYAIIYASYILEPLQFSLNFLALFRSLLGYPGVAVASASRAEDILFSSECDLSLLQLCGCGLGHLMIKVSRSWHQVA